MNIQNTELLIIGGGPAGLTAAQYGARAGLSVLVLEHLALGGQVLLIDRLENYPGLPSYTRGADFAGVLRGRAEELGAVFLSDSAASLSRAGGRFRAALQGGGNLEAQAVIAASGAKHRAMGIPGEDEFRGLGVSYCAACDGPFFRGKKILVVGGGDAACDEARFLSRLSPRVILIHRREKLRAQKAIAERTLKNSNIEVRFNTRILEIRGAGRVSSAVFERVDTGERYEENTAAVFIFIGAIPETAFLAGLASGSDAPPLLDTEGYILTDQSMAASVPGLFAAGDVRSSPFRQVVVAAGEGAVAAHSAAAYIDALKSEAYR
jgi:thioredoxin reductase (NADPH)